MKGGERIAEKWQQATSAPAPSPGPGVGECRKEPPVKGTPKETVSSRKNQVQLQAWLSVLAAHLID